MTDKPKYMNGYYTETGGYIRCVAHTKKDVWILSKNSLDGEIILTNCGERETKLLGLKVQDIECIKTVCENYISQHEKINKIK